MTTIETTPPRRRIRTDALREVRCPECGGSRAVSARHARRIACGEHDARCEGCRNPHDVTYSDEDIRYWLVVVGGRSIPENADVRAYLRVFGMPQLLWEISVGMQNVSVRRLA